MRPPGCGISARVSRHNSKGATKWLSSMWRRAGASSWVNGRRSRRPALFTSTSRRPDTCFTFASAAWRLTVSVTSKGRARTTDPWAACASTCATASASAAASRPLSQTEAPCAARASAMHNPSPRDAPVTSAVRPRRSNSAAGAAAQGRDGGGTGGLLGMQASYRCRGGDRHCAVPRQRHVVPGPGSSCVVQFLSG